MLSSFRLSNLFQHAPNPAAGTLYKSLTIRKKGPNRLILFLVKNKPALFCLAAHVKQKAWTVGGRSKVTQSCVPDVTISGITALLDITESRDWKKNV